MRANTSTVLAAFEQSTPKRPADSIWTDGENVWSYATCLLTKNPNGRGWIFNTTSYSNTTSEKQRGIRYHMAGRTLIEVDDMPRGARPEDLIRAARRAAVA